MPGACSSTTPLAANESNCWPLYPLIWKPLPPMPHLLHPDTSTRLSRHFDLIAFDWDGTLFDSTAIITRCIQNAVRDVGGTVPSDKDAAYVIGLGLRSEERRVRK